jgi:hypothetical protein
VSILLVQLTHPGILFGADRNITVQRTIQAGQVSVIVSGQTQRPKVLKWPNHEVIVGYVGQAELEGEMTDTWLYAFIGRNLAFADLHSLAATLQGELNAIAQAGGMDQPLIIHLGGFDLVGGEWTPRIYFIRNTTALTPEGAYVFGQHFDCTEELASPTYFGGKSGNEIQQHVAQHYFSFRQGYDLAAFGVIEAKLREAMVTLIYAHPTQAHPVPLDLDEWTKHVRFAVETYGTYFESFYAPFEQYVGGGSDVVWAKWPSTPSGGAPAPGSVRTAS